MNRYFIIALLLLSSKSYSMGTKLKNVAVAIERCDLELFRKLIPMMSALELSAPVNSGSFETLLTIAAAMRYKRQPIIIDGHFRGTRGFNSREGAQKLELREKYQDMCRMLVEKGADVNAGEPLGLAVLRDFQISHLLISSGANVQSKYLAAALSPVVSTSVDEQIQICKLLLQHGAKLNCDSMLEKVVDIDTDHPWKRLGLTHTIFADSVDDKIKDFIGSELVENLAIKFSIKNIDALQINYRQVRDAILITGPLRAETEAQTCIEQDGRCFLDIDQRKLEEIGKHNKKVYLGIRAFGAKLNLALVYALYIKDFSLANTLLYDFDADIVNN